jgi:uncharacterized coiled-coil protein SlyX
MTLEQRIAELEKRVAELEKVVQPEHIERELAKRLEKAFIEACRTIKDDV